MAPRKMSAADYVVDQDGAAGPVMYAAEAQRASGGARQAAGMAPYPLYGIGQTPATDAVPFYRTMTFGLAVGAAGMGALWAYFGWWRPRSSRKKKSERNKRFARRNMKAGNEE